MARTKYVIELNNEELDRLNEIIHSDDSSERAILRAKILLRSDVKRNSRISVSKLAEALSTTNTTVQTVRTEYANGGLEAAVFRKKRTPGFINKRINGTVIEQILKIAKETPPDGKKKWSIRMLCDEAVRRGIVSHIAPSTMAGILNRTKVK